MITRKIRERMLDIFSHYGQEFEPVLVHEDESIFIMDWRDKNGSGNLATRYIVDKKKGTLIITGDAGDCIACWYNKLTPEDLAVYINSVGYFVGKMQCTTDKYEWRDEDIKTDLENIKAELIRDKREHPDWYSWSETVIEDDFEYIADELDNYGWGGENQPFPDHIEDIMTKYYSEVWESPFADMGKRISTRVYLWIVGYQTGIEKLRGKEFVRKDFDLP